MNILDKIVAHKRLEVEELKQNVPIKSLKESIYYSRNCLSMQEYLVSESKSGLICEFKRKSPSKGLINGSSRVEDVVLSYRDAGASAVSVLTDEYFFGGSGNDLIRAREVLDIPVLRKDFIIDKYQIHEAKALGADAILLIAAILDSSEVEEFAKEAKVLGLSVLFEVHDENELAKLCDEILIVGVNNRNLQNFEVNIDNSISLSCKIPDNCLKISESGISKPETIRKLKTYGFSGFLIGENFMKNSDPGREATEFINSLSL